MKQNKFKKNKYFRFKQHKKYKLNNKEINLIDIKCQTNNNKYSKELTNEYIKNLLI